MESCSDSDSNDDGLEIGRHVHGDEDIVINTEHAAKEVDAEGDGEAEAVAGVEEGMNPKKLNLSQTILGKDYSIGDEGEAHDALYDAKLLERVLNEYCSAFSQRADIIIDTYMRDGEQIRSSVKYHLSSAKSIKKRLDQTEYFTFFGWDDAASWAHKEWSRKPDKLEKCER